MKIGWKTESIFIFWYKHIYFYKEIFQKWVRDSSSIIGSFLMVIIKKKEDNTNPLTNPTPKIVAIENTFEENNIPLVKV